MSRPVRYTAWVVLALALAALVQLVRHPHFVAIPVYPLRTVQIDLTSNDAVQPLLEQIQIFAQSNKFESRIQRDNRESLHFMMSLSRRDMEIIADNETTVRSVRIDVLGPEPSFFGYQRPNPPQAEVDDILSKLKSMASRIPGAQIPADGTAASRSTIPNP